MKPYEQYKPSGVAWLGEVPEHWEVKRLKFSVENVSEKINAKESDLRYFGLENIASFTAKLLDEIEIESEGIAHLFKKNDVLFGKLRPYLAKVYLAEKEGLVSTEALILRANNEILPNYLKYFVLSNEFIKAVDGTTFGSKMPRASWDDIGNFKMLIPPLPEQTAIATFLDERTAYIDRLITKQQALSEKLSEKRTALITEAVCGRLNTNAENLRDSGIQWLGKVPKHWEVKRLKFAVSYNDEVLSEQTDLDKEILYVDISSVSLTNGIKNKELMTFENAPSRARRIVKNGDVLISTVRTYLKAIAQIDNAEPNLIASTGFAVLRSKSGLNSKFLGYYVQSEGVVGAIVANSVGVSYPAINASDLVNLPICMPSETEQTAIANYLDQETAKIDRLQAKIAESVARLKEYRSALITQAVTGKIKV